MASYIYIAQALSHLPDAPATVEAVEGVATEAAHGNGPMDQNLQMVVWTWVTFAIVAVLLYKLAFKPIFAALEAREGKIRQAVDDADKARQQLEQIEQARTKLIAEADAKAKEMVEEARKSARDAALVIEEKARHEAQIQIENATREIRTATDKARAGLRQEAATVAVSLAGKILDQEIDAARQRILIDKLMREL